MTTGDTRATPRRIAIVGGGVSGLGAAWALNHHPDRFDFRLFEAEERIGGNAITADMPQEDGSSIPFDISVTACIPSVYQHILLPLFSRGISSSSISSPRRPCRRGTREHDASMNTYRLTFETRSTWTGLFKRCIAQSPRSWLRTPVVCGRRLTR